MGNALAAFHCAILDYAPPGMSVEIGTLIWDDNRERLCLVLLQDWRSLIQREDIEYFEALVEAIGQITAEGTVSTTIGFFEETLSNILRMRDALVVLATSMEAAAQLFQSSHTTHASGIDETEATADSGS